MAVSVRVAAVREWVVEVKAAYEAVKKEYTKERQPKLMEDQPNPPNAEMDAYVKAVEQVLAFVDKNKVEEAIKAYELLTAGDKAKKKYGPDGVLIHALQKWETVLKAVEARSSKEPKLLGYKGTLKKLPELFERIKHLTQCADPEVMYDEGIQFKAKTWLPAKK
jgi:hypothetical protein